MLVSPAEHNPLLYNLGPTSSQVEQYGVDFLFPTRMGLVGVQRKEIHDLVASKRGGRLQRELVQMRELDHAILLIEGIWHWTSAGNSRAVRSYTFAEHTGFLLSIQAQGILIMHTESIEGTAYALPRIETWFNKDGEHDSLLRKPKSKVAPELHILQHFDGISLTRAKAIYHHFGRVPLRWSCSRAQMEAVPGIGRVTVNNLANMLGGMDDEGYE